MTKNEEVKNFNILPTDLYDVNQDGVVDSRDFDKILEELSFTKRELI